jgi:hypothetical protein
MYKAIKYMLFVWFLGFAVWILIPSYTLHNSDLFYGEVQYSYTYESNKLNVDSLSKIKPVKSIFRYDAQNYQSSFIGKDTHTYYYISKLNKCLSQTNNLNNYECEDYSIASDSIISFKVYDTEEKILGHTCMIVEYQTKTMWNRYYVSKQFKITPDTYKNHKAYNWNFYGEKSQGGLILKLEHRFKNYTMKGIATSIKQDGIDFKAIELNEDIISKACKQ